MLKKTKRIRIPKTKQSRFSGKVAALCVALVLVICGTVSGALAWLADKDGPVVNQFDPSQVSCVVEEESFNENTGLKTNVSVKNTSDIDAYLRVRLVTYTTDKDENIIGGKTDLPTFTLGEGWIQVGEYYYCTTAIKAGKNTPVLIESCTLKEGQVLEVLAEAIQSQPDSVAKDKWNVTIQNGVITGGEGA